MDTKKALPLVTVGVASYNNAAYIRETLESIRLQTYPHIELIIVDDCSSDDSVSIAQKWLAEHPEINGRLIAHPINMGVCRTCNDLVTNARGEYLAMIGSDDIYLPDKLARQVPLLLNAPPEVGVVFGPVTVIDSLGKPLPDLPKWEHAKDGEVFLPMLQQNFISAMGTLIRRSCYDQVGLYDEELAYEDLDMWLRMARRFQFKYCPKVTAQYRVHQKSAMQSRQAILTESTLRLLHKHVGISAEADSIIANHTKILSECLYQWGGKQAKHWLHIRWKQDRKLNSWLLYALASVGVSGEFVKKAQRKLGR